MAVPRTSLSLALTATAALALTLAGCSPGGSSSGSGSDASAAAGAPAAKAGAAAQLPATQAGDAPAAVVQQRVIRTAQVVVRVDGELAPAAAKVRAIAEGLGGTVASETTTFADAGDPGTTAGPGTTTDSTTDSTAPPTTDTATAGPAAGSAGGPTAAAGAPARAAHPGQSLLVLRVPGPSLDQALTQITGPGGVGKELSRSASAQDVTGDLADLESRVATQRASVARIRALMGKAGSLQDVVLLESEVTKREADLEALEARRAALADRADLATLTVDLRTAAAVVPPEETTRNAFLSGLDSGWQALVASMTVILTVLGALLPLAIVLLLVGGPVAWVLRRRRRPVPAPAPAPAPSPGTGS